MSIVKKKKHVSKKNKKAWRKHCDIKDVEDFLEDQRLEERLGKFETKPDSELFILDTAGADNEQKENETKAVTAKQRKRANLPVTPKCLEILLPSSKAAAQQAQANAAESAAKAAAAGLSANKPHDALHEAQAAQDQEEQEEEEEECDE